MDKAILYVHGKGGSYLEAAQYEKNCPGFDIVGVDYTVYLPWVAEKQISAAYDALRQRYSRIYIIANSIGAYFSMHTLQKQPIEKALFISPIADMEGLILRMMQWANVTEQELCNKGEIETTFGETLSFKYLTYVREHPIDWRVPTEVLYAGKDTLTPRDAIDAFVNTHNAVLTVMENGEHWFHTAEQLAVLDAWMKKALL